MLTDVQKIQIRRHLGFPVAGNPVQSPVGGSTLLSGFQGYRFFTVYGQLEYRMNWMQPIEEAIITGLQTMVVTISAATTASIGAGLVLSVEIIQGSLDETVSYTTVAGDTIYSIGQNLANNLLANANLVAAGFYAASPLSTGAYSQAARPPAVVQPFPGLQITDLSKFNNVLTSATPVFLSAGSSVSIAPPPSATIDGELYQGYLAILDKIEGMSATSIENLDTEKADVWTARRDEVEAKEHLYYVWRQKLAEFMEIPLYQNTPYGAAVKGRRSGGIMVA